MGGFLGTIGAGIVVIAATYLLLNHSRAAGSIAGNAVNQLGRLENTFQANTGGS